MDAKNLKRVVSVSAKIIPFNLHAISRTDFSWSNTQCADLTEDSFKKAIEYLKNATSQPERLEPNLFYQAMIDYVLGNGPRPFLIFSDLYEGRFYE